MTKPPITDLDIVVLAAGKGKRMLQADSPKVLAPLGKKPLISHLLSEVKKFSPKIKPVVVVGFKKHLVKALLGDKVLFCWQKQLLGTAHALKICKVKVKKPLVLVLNGDMPFISHRSMEKLYRLHLKSQSTISMFTVKLLKETGVYSTMKHFGRIIRDESGLVSKIVEYKDLVNGDYSSHEVNPAVYIFDTEWLWVNISKIDKSNAQKEFYLTDLIKIASKQHKKITAIAIPAREAIGINTQEELTIAHKFLKSK